jgi:hypothetical protein
MSLMDMISLPATIDWHKHRRIPLFPARCRHPAYAVMLKDPLIFRQCIHLRDVAVLLNRGSYVEQYD